MQPAHGAGIPHRRGQRPHYDARTNELAPSIRRTLYKRGPPRRALLDTSVLATDIIAATRRPEPSSFVAGARAGTVRCLIPVHVWEEVPRVLAYRHQEGGRFDLGRALELAVPVRACPVRRGHRRSANDPRGSGPRRAG